MDNTHTFDTKFREYIDKNFELEDAHCHNHLVNLSFQTSVINIFDKCIVSELLYRADPVAYTELFDQWVLENLTNKGDIK